MAKDVASNAPGGLPRGFMEAWHEPLQHPRTFWILLVLLGVAVALLGLKVMLGRAGRQALDREQQQRREEE
jgi:hypothetical protein